MLDPGLWVCSCGAERNTNVTCRSCGDLRSISAVDPEPDRDWRSKSADGGLLIDGIATDADPLSQLESVDPLEYLNRSFFVIEEGGKHFVAMEIMDEERSNRTMIKRFSFDEFRKRFPGQFVPPANPDAKPKSLPKAWLEWAGRRQFLGGTTFDPTGRAARPDQFNLWRGWGVTAEPAPWNLIKHHLWEVVCGSDPQLFRYLIGWMASLVQHPERPAGVAIVLRGLEGAGKTTVGDLITRMLPKHSLAVSSPRAVTGQFNAHLRDLVFLVANEAVFAGDKANFSVLKSLITDGTLFVEQKGIDAIETRNFLHVLMTTNAEWAVPVTLSDRRFACYDVSPRYVGNKLYFDQLYQTIGDDRVIGGMLYDLLHLDLTNFNIRLIPETKARQDQQQHTLVGVEAWLLEVLTIGSLGVGDVDRWDEWASTRTIQESHEKWARSSKHRQGESAVMVGRHLSRFFQPKKPRTENGSRHPGYFFGSLEQARDRFCAVTKLPRDTFHKAEIED